MDIGDWVIRYSELVFNVHPVGLVVEDPNDQRIW